MATLDLDAIAAAGLALVDHRGADALTMRAVATELGVSTMSLYHYVENKAALVELLVDKAHREQPLPAPSGEGWREEVRELAGWMRNSIRAHPALLRLRLEYNVYTPSMLTFGERWINLWQQSGLDFDAANRAAAASSMAIIGFAKEEVSLRDFKPPDPELLSWLPNMRHLSTSPPEPGTSFELFIRALIDGIFDVLARGQAIAGDAAPIA